VERSTIGSFLRAMQARCGQICEKETLEFGIAYYSQRFAAIPDACQLREVWLPDSSKLTEAFRQSEAWFASKGLRCLRWAAAEGQPIDRLQPFLIERGFTPQESVVMGLGRWVECASAESLRILPARAMRAVFRETFLAEGGAAWAEALADAALERLDDPQLDMFVALRDKRPVGRCGLHQVGDIGQVGDLWVAEGRDSLDVEAALLHYVLALAKRLAMPTVLVQAPAADTAQQERFASLGFVAAARHVEFDRVSPGAAR